MLVFKGEGEGKGKGEWKLWRRVEGRAFGGHKIEKYNSQSQGKLGGWGKIYLLNFTILWKCCQK